MVESPYGTNATDLYKMYFYSIIQEEYSQSEDWVLIDTITCDTYISKYLSDLNDFQLQSIKNELYGHPRDFLCPDIDTI